ncbi:3'-5' exonuclease [Brevibacillus porteri]|uniref:3'-5' exonuclease n=1 Tax=Brevibacillus porteri TaxID=2126350 RepID=UPI003D21F221
MQNVTLTKKQQEAVDYEGQDLLIRGIAGSGKTIVLLNKANKILTKYVDEKVYLFTFNGALSAYAKELASIIGSDRLVVTTFHSWAMQMLGKIRVWFKVVDQTDKDKSLKKSIEKVREQVTHRLVLEEKYFDFLNDEISWMKGKDLRQKEQYMGTDRIGRGTKVFVDKKAREVIYSVFSEYQKELQQLNRVDFDDLAHLLHSKCTNLKSFPTLDNVLVDEAQDLQELQLKLLKKCANKRMIIAADKGQKIYNTSFTWRDIGVNITGGRTKLLQDSFRSTKQIISLAHSLQKHDPLYKNNDEEYVHPILPERTGPMPRLAECEGYEEEEEYIVHAAKELLTRHPDWTIGILSRGKTTLSRFYKRLRAMGVPIEYVTKKEGSAIKPGVKLMSFHSAKGLEFDTAFVIRLREKTVPSYDSDDDLDEETLAVERRLLYVAMTRAKSILIMTYYQKRSRFIEEMDSSLYKYERVGGNNGDSTLFLEPTI